ncbi:tRNA (adenosine(37)-N6)-threonylcarbamoyltransferase complex ATPase subunit type 1 TsaE [Lancefieldella rimae]|uniref:tRNA threonylcarbamoyladenosine biosynthesis protein TsaE n=2 Tax=Lancefieldella rimae TaxID=1383 RepID=B9CMG1_LANR4|nr:tRNA (adenosine(37)-N6)-threonylcarbamoyltransferase complex ATPase subunit type 1 TsaE [Lancefieldella rimae]EEE17264.1 hydrolase, P-loop family [Lancefieldella rimae ATCC 49626]
MSKLPRMVDSGIFVSSSTAETIALGEKCGELLAAGDVLVLTGDLGAGKTQFTKGIARGMGITADVTSPTFTIEMVYEGSVMPLYHFDLYRLNDSSQLDDIGLFDAMESDGPTVIEWGEQFADDIGDDRADVFISRLDGAGDANATDAATSDLGEGTGDISATSAEPLREIRFVAHNKRGQELIERLVLFLH